MHTWLLNLAARAELARLWVGQQGGLDAGFGGAARLPRRPPRRRGSARAGRPACCSRGGTRWPASAAGTWCTPAAIGPGPERELGVLTN